MGNGGVGGRPAACVGTADSKVHRSTGTMNVAEHHDPRSESPAGAVFHRCALQVNPHHYSGTFRGKESPGDAASYAAAIVAEAAAEDVSVLAITDHNHVGAVPTFRDAAAGSGVEVLPGFELASAEGVHVLCIYPSDTDQEKLGRFLGEFGIRETTPASTLSTQSFDQLLANVRAQGGIAVAAHVTGDGGLLNTLSGQSRINAWCNERLLAAQIPGAEDELPVNFRRIVENADPQYRRPHPVALINAKDVASPEDLGHPSATCLIKMSKISIEGLRQAFLDPGSRIRLNPRKGKTATADHAEFLSLGWEGGFLDGVHVRLNPNLNVLVGGRGAGKSTVIESLRYVMGLEPIGETALSAHTGVVRHVLRAGTKISLRARSQRPTAREYTIERTVPNPPIVRDGNGRVSRLLPGDVIPRVEVYGQHEISELARSKAKLTQLLDRFVDRDASLERRKTEVRRELEKTRASLLDVAAELGEIDGRLAALPSLEETLERYREAGLEERLSERSLLVREERVLDSIPERLSPLHESLGAIRANTPIDRFFLSEKALDDLPGKAILKQADSVLERLSRLLRESVERLDEAFAKAEDELGAVRSRWNERKRDVQRKYEKILRELKRSAVDGEEFIRLRHDIESLRPLRERRALLRRLKEEQTVRRRSLLAEWEDLKAGDHRSLDRAAKKVGRKLADRVQVEVTASGNREPLFKTLRDGVGGRLGETIDAIGRAETFSLPQFVESCRQGAGAVRKLGGVSTTGAIPASQAKRLADSPEGVLMEIEELELPSVTTIRLNTAPVGDPPAWRALDDLSTGQKATAVLLLLLLDSDAPLVVDQPEDDLDNRFISEGVVPRMRDEKGNRQFIFSTHNANIPVLGDAELILGLTAKGEAGEGSARIAPEHLGSIDESSVRDIVEELLEGGRNAFETRRRKYGF